MEVADEPRLVDDPLQEDSHDAMMRRPLALMLTASPPLPCKRLHMEHTRGHWGAFDHVCRRCDTHNTGHANATQKAATRTSNASTLLHARRCFSPTHKASPSPIIQGHAPAQTQGLLTTPQRHGVFQPQSYTARFQHWIARRCPSPARKQTCRLPHGFGLAQHQTETPLQPS